MLNKGGVLLTRDQLTGIIIIIGALIIAGIYSWLIYAGLSWWAFFIIATIAIIGVVGIVAWIGWVMATTPPPTPLDDFEELSSASEDNGIKRPEDNNDADQ
jgi:predicted DNA-binding transcriptional regulator